MTKVFTILGQAIATTQRRLVELWRRVPGSAAIDELAELLTRPIRALADGCLRRWPWLARWEWLLEVDRLRRIPPVMLVLVLGYVFYRGIQTTHLGHIGTDRLIYPLLSAISYFNPFLGIVSAALFGIGDLLQKLVVNDIYGSRGVGRLAPLAAYGDLNYWGGVVGYAVAYSSLVMAGFVPGLLARVFRLAVQRTITFVLFRRAAAAADGASSASPYAGAHVSASPVSVLMPGGVEPRYPVAELAAAVIGAGVGGAGVMYFVAPTLEAPAFLWRPNPDVSCHNLEVSTFLQQPALSRGGVGGASGGLVMNSLVPMPPTPGAPAGPEVRDEPVAREHLSRPLVDPETGRELLVHDGSYEGGWPGQVWHQGRWMDPAEAAALITRWDEALSRDRREWFDRETRQWEADVERRRREEGYGHDPYRDEWRELPPEVAPVEIPPEDPDIWKVQRTKEDPGFLHRMFVGPSSADHVKMHERFTELDTLHTRALTEYLDTVRAEREAREKGDTWLAEVYRARREPCRANVTAIRGATLDLTGRVADTAEGGRVQRQNLAKQTQFSWWKVGRELVWDPVKAIFKPDVADERGDGPIGTAFKRLKAASDAMRENAREQPALEERFRDAMNATKLHMEQLTAARLRGDATAVRVLEEQVRAAREQALEANHQRGELSAKTRDWERAAARVTHQYYKSMSERIGAGQVQYKIGRAGSRVAAKVTGAFDADPRMPKSVKGEADAWDRLQKEHRHEMQRAREHLRAGTEGQHSPVTLTKYEVELDRRWKFQQSVAERKIVRYETNRAAWERTGEQLKAARRSGDSERIMEAFKAHEAAERRLGQSVNRGLSDVDVKMQLKRAPSDVQHAWNTDVERFRTTPVRSRTVDLINQKKPWVVEQAPGKFRRLSTDDLKSVSSRKGAGLDLDLNPDAKVVDMRTGQRVSDAQLQGAVNEACRSLRIDAARQDIHVSSTRHPSAYRVPAGHEPSDVLKPDYVRRSGPMDGEQMKQVSDFKRLQEVAPGDLAGKAYQAVKDYRRFTKEMIEAHPGARPPRVLNEKTIATLEDLGNRKIGPGTAAARIKHATGMSIDEACEKLNSLQQSVPTLDSPARRIDLANARAAAAPPGSAASAPPSGYDLRGLVGDKTPALRTKSARELYDALKQRDPASFVDADGNVRAVGTVPTPEITNTKAAIEARAAARGYVDSGASGRRAFAERLDDVRAADPVFRGAHDKVQKAMGEGFSRRIDEIAQEHSAKVAGEGRWGEPGSTPFKAEVGRRINITPLDDPRAVQHQQRAMFEHGVTEAEFDAYVGVRQKVWQGEPVAPVKPLPPADGRTPHYVDIEQRLGSGPEASPSATPMMSPPGQTAPSATQAPQPPPVEPPPQAPAAPVRRALVSSEPAAGAEAPGAAPDPVRPAPERPAASTREPVRPEPSRPDPVSRERVRPEPPRPEPSPPEVRRPEPARPVATRPTPEPLVAPARIALERVKPARRFLDFFTRR